MLPPFIIEQIRKREEDRRQDNRAQPHLELPIPSSPTHRRIVPDDDVDRGITIIELG